MCCLSAALGSALPRIGILVWWLVDRMRWDFVFDHFVWGLVGFMFVPWMTLAYVWVAPGGVQGIDWLWLVLGLVVDIGNHGGGARSWRRRRLT